MKLWFDSHDHIIVDSMGRVIDCPTCPCGPPPPPTGCMLRQKGKVRFPADSHIVNVPLAMATAEGSLLIVVIGGADVSSVVSGAGGSSLYEASLGLLDLSPTQQSAISIWANDAVPAGETFVNVTLQRIEPASPIQAGWIEFLEYTTGGSQFAFLNQSTSGVGSMADLGPIGGGYDGAPTLTIAGVDVVIAASALSLSTGWSKLDDESPGVGYDGVVAERTDTTGTDLDFAATWTPDAIFTACSATWYCAPFTVTTACCGVVPSRLYLTAHAPRCPILDGSVIPLGFHHQTPGDGPIYYYQLPGVSAPGAVLQPYGEVYDTGFDGPCFLSFSIQCIPGGGGHDQWNLFLFGVQDGGSGTVESIQTEFVCFPFIVHFTDWAGVTPCCIGAPDPTHCPCDLSAGADLILTT